MKTRRPVFDLLVIIFVSLMMISVFAFMVLIPEAKQYRSLSGNVKKIEAEVSKLQLNYDHHYAHNTGLQKEYNSVLKAVDNTFDKEEFIVQYRKDFTDLRLEVEKQKREVGSAATWKMLVHARFKSPKNFYSFMEKINHAEWIMTVKTPIRFERVGDEINATFGMKVYTLD